MLDWEGCFNVRDVGGLPTADGQTVRHGALVRADSLTRLTEAGCATARAHGISVVIDLRSSHEFAEGEPVIRRLRSGPALETAGPHPFCALDGVVYRQMRLRDYSDEEFTARVRSAKSQVDIYRMIIRDGAAAFARVAREVIAAPPGAVVVHCSVGKDRTGLIVAVLLSAVGVPDEAIAADYARSEECLRPFADFRRALGVAPSGPEPAAEHLKAPVDQMMTLLAELRDQYGGAADYLRAGGLSDAELAALRRRLVG